VGLVLTYCEAVHLQVSNLNHKPNPTLPDDGTSAKSLSTFRQRLKTHLFAKFLFSDYSLDWTSPNLSLVDLAVVCVTFATSEIPDWLIDRRVDCPTFTATITLIFKVVS